MDLGTKESKMPPGLLATRRVPDNVKGKARTDCKKAIGIPKPCCLDGCLLKVRRPSSQPDNASPTQQALAQNPIGTAEHHIPLNMQTSMSNSEKA